MFTCLVFLWQVVVKTTGGTQEKKISLTQLLNDADQGKINDVVVNGADVTGHDRDDPKNQFETTIPGNYPDMYKTLRDHGVNITISYQSPNQWLNILISIAPFALLFGLWFFLPRQMQSGGNKAMKFGKSRARLLSMQQKKITFKDVAGVDEAKEELKEIIEFLREAQKFQRLGGRIPKGVLLVGLLRNRQDPPRPRSGRRSQRSLLPISGSDFVEMFVGVGATRVRDLFEQGKKNAPCIIFIDEIDAVGRHRGAGLGGGHDELEQTLNQLLVEMDGFESNDGVILVAATNRPDVLDPALLRPGRFDRRVIVDRPDIRGREELLRVHSGRSPWPKTSTSTPRSWHPGLLRGRPGQHGQRGCPHRRPLQPQVVHMYDFEAAKDKVMMGAERKSMLLTDDEKRDTAYHEAGHMLVSALREHSDPLHKVTIIPRGMALGVTMHLPEEDQHTVTKDYLETQLAILMGGRCAERSS